MGHQGWWPTRIVLVYLKKYEDLLSNLDIIKIEASLHASIDSAYAYQIFFIVPSLYA